MARESGGAGCWLLDVSTDTARLDGAGKAGFGTHLLLVAMVEPVNTKITQVVKVAKYDAKGLRVARAAQKHMYAAQKCWQLVLRKTTVERAEMNTNRTAATAGEYDRPKLQLMTQAVKVSATRLQTAQLLRLRSLCTNCRCRLRSCCKIWLQGVLRRMRWRLGRSA